MAGQVLRRRTRGVANLPSSGPRSSFTPCLSSSWRSAWSRVAQGEGAGRLVAHGHATGIADPGWVLSDKGGLGE